MRPILLEIDAELLFKLGWALMGIGAAWAFYGLVRASLGLAGRAGGRGVVSDQLQNVALGGVLGVAGFFATRYVGTPIPLYSYGILLGLAVVLGWVFAVRSAIRAGLGGVDTRVALGLGLALALLGARALFVAMNPALFEGRGFAEWLNLKNGGLVAWGGLIAAAALHLSGRSLARRCRQTLGGTGRRRHPRRHRLDGDAAYLPFEPPRPDPLRHERHAGARLRGHAARRKRQPRRTRRDR